MPNTASRLLAATLTLLAGISAEAAAAAEVCVGHIQHGMWDASA
jgi:hypothetical protein